MRPRRDTGHLENVLRHTSVNQFDQYIRNAEIYPENSLHTYFNEYIAARNLTPSVIVEKSGLAREYAYQILNGRKQHPSRDKIICLCIASGMSYEEIQRALKLGRQGILYAKTGRDAAIIICLHNGIRSVREINSFLTSRNFTPLQ